MIYYQYIGIAIIWRIWKSYYSHGIDCHGIQHKISHNFSSESQAKFCQDRVAKVEKHYGNLCETLASITRKAARQRDKGIYYIIDGITFIESLTGTHGLRYWVWVVVFNWM